MLKTQIHHKTDILKLSKKIQKLQEEQESFRREIKGWKETVARDVLKNAEMIKMICNYLSLSPDNNGSTIVIDESEIEPSSKTQIEEIILSPDTELLESPVNFVEVEDNWNLDEKGNNELLCYYCGVEFQNMEDLEKHLDNEHGSPVCRLDSSESCPPPQTDVSFLTPVTFEISKAKYKISSGLKLGNNFGKFILKREIPLKVPAKLVKSDQSLENIHLETNADSLLQQLDLIAVGAKEKEASRRFWCINDCGKSFKHRHHMMQHADTNCGTIRNFECAVCGRRFVKKNNMKSHILEMHFLEDITGGQTFDCSDCGQTYRHRRDLARHMKSKCGTIRNHMCSICGKMLSTKYHARKHMQRIHTLKS